MPTNWGDPQDVQAFESEALQQGLDPSAVKQYISQNSSSNSATPSASPSPAAQAAKSQTVNSASAIPDVQLPKMQAPQTPQNDPSGGLSASPNFLSMAIQKKAAQQAAPQSAPPSDQSQKPYDPTGKTQAQIMAETGHQSDLDAMSKAGKVDPSTGNMKSPPAPTPQPFSPPPTQMSQSPVANQLQKPIDQNVPQFNKPQQPDQAQGTILPVNATLTQHAGNVNPGLEVFSGGVARDTNYGVPMNTPIALPKGTWKVDQAYGNANPVGGARDSTNQGYGNMVKVTNADTGESLLMEHLADEKLQQGQTVQGGTVFGHTGMSGNATGPNVGIEYADKSGKLGNVENTPYADMIMPKSTQPAAQPTQQPAVTGANPPPLNPAKSTELDSPTSSSTSMLGTSMSPSSTPAASMMTPSLQPPSAASQPQMPLQTPAQTPGNVNPKLLSAVPQGQQGQAQAAIPAITDALKEQGITDPKAVSYALATASHESGFTPKEEQMAQRGINPRNDYIAGLQDNYEGGKDFRGRGYIQLTGKSNYENYGKQIGVDLVNHPELANDPAVAAKVLAAYMKNSGAADKASKGDYTGARIAVQGRGATNPEFIQNTNDIASQAQQFQQYLQ